ncbi:glycoside hydrolase family 2 TIM barrel-domain containing protein [Prolixibacter sp. NT017]|uniref:glycoside hydrolase family 2 protein n=1 Tax=Prolixibacter sp. NT017 TaxID=2652390 RepID=UPI00127AA309|nr:glycoside hydrolase family 2 TIM barrel-domain containing protein [Prolixibacter sp. NT017]GET25955.1 beta-mannosidase [Prolixibacter sp. NT017]
MQFQGNLKTIMSLLVLILMSGCGYVQDQSATLKLDKDWTLQPYGEWSDDGQLIKPDVYSSKNELTCDVPTTVFAAMVKDGKFKDPFFSENLEKVPREWFNNKWRYTKAFDIPENLLGTYSRLCFGGINYSADVFLNGKQIASADTLKGAFQRFEIDVTGKLKKKGNRLQVDVYPPQPGDFTVGFVDWTPKVPDKNMGLWRGVKLRFNGPVSIEHPFVESKVNTANDSEAALTIETQVVNHSGMKLEATVEAQIGDVTVKKKVALKPFEKRMVVWTPKEYPALNFKNAKLWWPVTMGDPNLYTLNVSSKVDNQISDKLSQEFGIREVTSYINEAGSRAYKINGRDLQIRGGGWADDLLLREKKDNLKAQVEYTKLMNLNTIRLEGFWGESDELYKLCDENGILIMVGWSCEWEWENYVGKKCDEFGGVQTPEEIKLVSNSLDDQVLWLRNHPSIFVWVLGSDMLPRPALEKTYLKNLEVSDPTRPTLSACSVRTSEVTGPTAVKMNGPYDYVSPNYWYIDSVNGGAFGFNTETGPGPQIPPIETLKRMFPADKLWPVNEIWNYHCGRGEFHNIDTYLKALNHRYGEAKNIDDFEMKAQMANYEAIRPMFEAFAVNKANAGGVIQWMLNAPWPKLYWQLYDYYLTPNGAFFGTQNALKPLNIIYNYGNHGIYISNDYRHGFKDLTAEVKVLDLQSKVVLDKKVPFSVDEYTSKELLSLPEMRGTTPVYFADLRIVSPEGKEIAHSFYWLSQKKDVPDFKNTKWYVTPIKEYADFTALTELPKVKVEKTETVEQHGDQTWVKVTLKNPSDKLAFFIGLKAKTSESHEMILPVFWNDNYISLLPGEERELTVKMNTKDLNSEQPVIEMKGYNTL